LITSTLLTLFVLPVLYKLFGSAAGAETAAPLTAATLLLLLCADAHRAMAQAPLTLDQAVQQAIQGHPGHAGRTGRRGPRGSA
jgi:hypothetical protein